MFAKREDGFDAFDPANVAPLVSYLASPNAGHISGEVFIVWGPRVTIVQRPTIDTHYDNPQGGKWTQEARIRVVNFYVMAATAPEVPAASAAPVSAPAAPQAQTVAGAATGPSPAAKPAATAAAAMPAVAKSAPLAASGPVPVAPQGAVGDHRVQLGAFSSVENAEAEWTRVRARFATLQGLDPRITAVQAKSKRLYRLQATLPDAAAAQALCGTLKAGGQACLYVPPK